MDHHGGVDAALERFARALERSLEQRYPGFEFSVRRRAVACGRKTDRRVWFATAAGMTHALDCHVVARDLRRPGRARALRAPDARRRARVGALRPALRSVRRRLALTVAESLSFCK